LQRCIAISVHWAKAMIVRLLNGSFYCSLVVFSAPNQHYSAGDRIPLNKQPYNLDHHWMPYTGNRAFKLKPRMIVGAKGNYFQSDDGRQVFDSLSGLWCCGAGHSVTAIADAIGKQLQTNDFSPGFQFGHPLSFELAEKICEFMPAGLNRVMFTNSGSESADTSLKIARAYWQRRGLPTKTKLIGRGKGYHGVNFGGMSVGGIEVNKSLFGAGLDTDHLASTLLPENTFCAGMPQYGEHLANELEQKIALHGASTIAAVIVEPLSGSGGVVVPPVGYLQRLSEICKQQDILLIFDEVITGFGRCGANTGAEAFGVVPDIINLAKQLTNGVIPMGAVVVREEIYNRFMETPAPPHAVEFPHGYTYSGHPVACAAALATLKHIQEAALVDRVQQLAPVLQRHIHGLRAMPHVSDIRNFGLTGAIALEGRDGDATVRPYEAGVALWEAGFYVRWGGDTLQFGPPFTTTEAELERLFSTVADVLETLV
jgi:beta-alanine--pyruvate transaminase